MIQFETIKELTKTELPVGDLVEVFGEYTEGDVPTMTGKVISNDTRTANRTVNIANGLKVEIYPTSTDATKAYVDGSINKFHTEPAVPYVAGIVIDKMTDKVTKDGIEYVPNTVPFTTVDWESDKGKFDETLDSKESTRVDVSIASIKEDAIKRLEITTEITVGTGGMFSTLTAALEYASSKYYKVFKQGTTTGSAGLIPDNVQLTVKLLAGFIMEEQIVLRQTNLGWITLVSEDPTVTIHRASLTLPTYFHGTSAEMYPAFYAGDNSTLPVINCKFNMDSSGTADNRHWLVCNRNSTAHINPGAGCTNAGGHGVYARESSYISCRLVDVTGAGTAGIIAANAANISAQGCTANTCNVGVLAVDGSSINFAGGSATGCREFAVSCLEGSCINASSGKLTGAVKSGIRASNCIKVSAYKADVSGAGEYGVLAEQASVVSILEGKANACGTGIKADSASTVNFQNGQATQCKARGLYALAGSIINALNSDLTGAVTNGALANIASSIALNGAKCRIGSSDSTADIAIGNGSNITAAAAIGGTSVAPNTLTRDGFITK